MLEGTWNMLSFGFDFIEAYPSGLDMSIFHNAVQTEDYFYQKDYYTEFPGFTHTIGAT